MTQDEGKGDNAEDFSLYLNDGNFKIKPRRIKLKKSSKKKKKDVKTELENTKMDLIQ